VAWITRSSLPQAPVPVPKAPLGDPAAGTGTGITGIPVQLRPRIYVAEVAPGVSTDAYVRSLQQLFRPTGLNDPAALSAAAVYRQPATSPYSLVDPTAQQSVSALIAKLTAAIEAVYPLPAGETLVSSQITCLSAPVYDLPAGIVVYVRTTDRATVQFVLPRVTVDPSTGVPSLRTDTPLPAAPARPAPPTGQLGDATTSIAKAASDDETFASYTDLWLADYTNFLTAIDGYSENGVNTPGWAVRIANHIEDFQNARLAQISEPYRYDDQRWVVVTGGGSTGTSGSWVDFWGWTYKDSGNGDTDTTNFVADYNTSADCCGNGASNTQYQAQVQAARDQHVADVSA